MSISKIQPGMSFSRNFKVRPEWAADRMGSGHVPVLSTAALVLAMENTASSSILPYLEEGTTSVGSRVEIVHLYPTPVGEFFTIDLVVAKVDRSRIDFTLTARDEHRVISTGFHRRHVVDTAKFLEKVIIGDPGSGNSATELPVVETAPAPDEEVLSRRRDLDSEDFNDNDTIF
ncbi:thioesterase family protein [Myxococcota bacterium]|jgi:predicted thioesterase|nr:thioesterase family protein [Myxococcota bacterium]MBU1410462.1 thioesterase family protein [Myxococcota bacterium]MBU1510349.1 thioesterase family protein [Myxococcota bacterium]PKN25618.1 MAG: thioesterase [Deltaproteobacteria bacterium HGW-Deltaproteobacteria-22]